MENRSHLKEFFNTILGLIIIVLILYASFRVVEGGWGAFKSLKENTQIAISIALLSLVGTLYSLYYTKIKDRQLQIEASHASKKQKLYDQFIKDLFEMLVNPEKANDEEAGLSMRRKFISNSILWANPEVLNAYHRFRINTQYINTEAQINSDLATLFLAFRKDLGLSNKDLNSRTILEIIYDDDYLRSIGLDFTASKK